jgi:predicted alpha/beta superfamily hydrolase
MRLQIQATIEQFALPHPNGERDLQISVWRAVDSADDVKNLPVMFVLDADLEFAMAAETARLATIASGAPAAMVVGIGYGESDFDTFVKLRSADLTQPGTAAAEQDLGEYGKFLGNHAGGAAAFLAFLIDTLAPEVNRRYPEAAPDQHILFGHSLGGLFTAYALLTRPDAFATFVVASPALWWDGFSLLTYLPAFPEKLKGLSRQPKVLVTVGGTEQDVPTVVPPRFAFTLEQVQALAAASRMVDAAREFSEALRTAGLDAAAYVAFDGEDHTSAFGPALMRGLRFAAAA